MPNASESLKVKEIDRIILKELKKNLEIKKDNVNILDKAQTDMIFKRINEKREIIFLLFNGDFSENEYNIKKRMYMYKDEKLSMYDRIANNVISKRLEKIFDKIVSIDPQNRRIISVCGDRLFFLQSVLKENISIDFVRNNIDILKREI